ncbi:MAG: hypothetical protein K2X39_01365, partial [Silvanigrellaceae bacterium]|nr:hypothetical protein [Silvanigrellaceae bacterium]
AFTSNRFGKPMIFTRDLISQIEKRITYSGWYNASARWSPDSQKIAFASYDRDIDKWDLFKMNSDGSSLERLTLNQGDNEKPSWSPDGRFILFQSNRIPKSSAVGKVTKLYIMNADGTNVRQIQIPLAEAKLPSWSGRILHSN